MAKILIMDGELSSRNMISNMLRPLGNTLLLAEDGKKAMEVAEREKPEVALLDMHVEDMEGTEVLMGMKKIKPDMKCIMLSAFGSDMDALGAIGLGALGVLSKPFKITEVHKTVMAALQGKLVSGMAAVRSAAAVSAASAPAPAPAPAATTAPVDTSPSPVYRAPAVASNPASVAAAPAPAPAPVAEQVYEEAVPAPARRSPLIKVAAGICAAVVAIGIFLFARGSSGPEVKEYNLSYANPTGMCFIKNNLWVSDWTNGTIYHHSNNDKLTVSAAFKSDNQHPSGLAYDGDYIWSCSPSEKRLYKHRLDESLSTVSIYALPMISPQGLYFDGVNLWIIDSDAAKIYKHRMDDTLSVVAVYDSPAINPCGMFSEGEFFYIGDYKTGRIYKASVKDLAVSDIFELPNFDKERDKLAGIAWDGNHLWVCYDGVPQVFRHNLKKLKKIKF